MKNQLLLLLLPFYIFSYQNFLEEIIDPLPERNVIPKIIHQIWIGPKPFPEKMKKYVETWKKNHPTWEYKLWTNKDIKDFPWILKDVFDKSTNYGMKSDIWRYEILYQYGGLYVDVDFECLKPFDKLLEKLTFFTCYMKCLENPTFLSTDHHYCVNGAILAAPPKHYLIKNMFDHINRKKAAFAYQNIWNKDFLFCGPYFLSLMLPTFDISNIKNGYCILPWEITHSLLPDFLKARRNIDVAIDVRKRFPNAMAIHHHCCTWQ